MIRKFCLLLGLFCGTVFSAKAADLEVLREIYTLVPLNYVQPLSVEDMAVRLLKGIDQVDKKLKVGNDGKRMSLYYKGRLLRSVSKPSDPNDVEAWVDLSAVLMDLAAENSPLAAKHDFELPDLMMQSAVKTLDKDSKFYSNPEEMKGKRLKYKRKFAARLEDGDKLYLKILAFNNSTEKDVTEAIRNYPDIQGVILDLRENPGGSLEAAIALADLFLDNSIIASSHGKNNKDVVFYHSKEGDVLNGLPLVVLTDGKTASSAEVVTAALQQQSRAKVVGTQTFGKGSSQSLISLSSGSTASITSAYFYTPSGDKLDGKGVAPNYCTYEMPEGKNIERFLALGEFRPCFKENREDSGFDLAVAEALIDQLNGKITHKKDDNSL